MVRNPLRGRPGSRDLDDDDDESRQPTPASRPHVGAGLSREVLQRGVARALATAVVGVVIVGTYVLGTRYEIGGSLKDAYRIDRITGVVRPVAIEMSIGDYKAATHYFRPDQLKVLRRQSERQNRDVNELVREALQRYLDDMPSDVKKSRDKSKDKAKAKSKSKPKL